MAGENLVECRGKLIAAGPKAKDHAKVEGGHAPEHRKLALREVEVLMGDCITPHVELLQVSQSRRATSVELRGRTPNVEIEAFEVRADATRMSVPAIELPILRQ